MVMVSRLGLLACRVARDDSSHKRGYIFFCIQGRASGMAEPESESESTRCCNSGAGKVMDMTHTIAHTSSLIVLSPQFFQAVQIGRLPETCDASNAGNLYYSPNQQASYPLWRLSMDSNRVHAAQFTSSSIVSRNNTCSCTCSRASTASKPGSYDNPIASCSVLHGSEAKSGTYWMKPPTYTDDTPFQVLFIGPIHAKPSCFSMKPASRSIATSISVRTVVLSYGNTPICRSHRTTICAHSALSTSHALIFLTAGVTWPLKTH